MYYHIRAEAVRTSCSAIAITIKMSDKVSEVTKDSFVALAARGAGGGSIAGTGRSWPLTAQGATRAPRFCLLALIWPFSV